MNTVEKQWVVREVDQAEVDALQKKLNIDTIFCKLLVSRGIKNYEDAIPRVAAKYEQGVRGVSDFNERAIAGEENYKTGVTEAAAEGRRAAGLAAISPTKWQDAAATKGRDRIAGGMNASKAEYGSKIAKVISVL
ncbi:MAG: hypothetical protein IIA45_14420, partial [Bacteroidetes bacterium]|nr:hypothetical protein [Bacteroidota bacterium]